MSGGTACRCTPRRVMVWQRNCHRSAFNGYRWTPSRYSSVECLSCGRVWRTTAKYVATAPDASDTEGVARIRAAMVSP